MTNKIDNPKVNDLRVWWIPQVPMKPFHVPVNSIREAKLVLDTLANYDLFQLSNHIKPDYSNMGGLERYEDVDGDGNLDWCEWESEDGEDNIVYPIYVYINGRIKRIADT
jgi:hypothetical protein